MWWWERNTEEVKPYTKEDKFTDYVKAIKEVARKFDLEVDVKEEESLSLSLKAQEGLVARANMSDWKPSRYSLRVKCPYCGHTSEIECDNPFKHDNNEPYKGWCENLDCRKMIKVKVS